MMMTMEESLDWKKLENNSEKAGYRDGIEDGRQSDFQNSFDLGYKSGFENGFKLGFAKAQHKNPNFEEKKGNCEICKDTSVFDLQPIEKHKIQIESTEKFLKSLSDIEI